MGNVSSSRKCYHALLEQQASSVCGTSSVCSVSRKSELNLFSGLAHVLADTLRSLTQVAVGVVILAGGPSNIVDGCGTLAISSTILLGALFLLYEVGVQWRHAMECARCNGGDASYTQWL